MIKDLVSLAQLFKNSHDVGAIAKLLQRGAVELTGLYGSSKAFFVASLLGELGSGIVLVTSNNRSASDLYTDLEHFVTSDSLYLFPSRETLPYDESEPYREITIKRIVALASFLSGARGIFIIPVRTFTDLFIPKEEFRKCIIQLEKDCVCPPRQLMEKLLLLGYTREDRVNVPGSFALRGDILDVFVTGAEHPFRVEFFDEMVESIREFSPLTQKSLQEVDAATIIPIREMIVTDAAINFLKKNINPQNKEVTRKIIDFGSFRGIENFISIMYAHPNTVLDYAGGNYLFLFDSLVGCRKIADFFYSEATKIFEEKKKRTFLLPPGQICGDFDLLLHKVDNFCALSILPESSTDLIDFNIKEKKGYRGQIKYFKEDLESYLQKGYRVIIGASFEGQTIRLRELLKDQIGNYQNLSIITCDLHEGFIDEKMKIFVILDREIFNRKRRYGTQFLEVKSQSFEGILDIKEGEYIVHIEHGIGIYRGIEKLKTAGAEKDFIKIEYKDGDEIFIPVDQINLLQKYIGHEGRRPRIDKLGSGTWKKVKDQVRRSVRNMAKELLELYSVRASMKGHSYTSDSEWQFEFESGFRYEETPDQIRTVEEIKRDMESTKPMDRLVCGDVGFGKTEVAIRAAFKAVMDGKQVAVLVPTTILAEQHLGTFSDRFSLYPINVEMLSRFKTQKEQHQIVRDLKEGLIDVVIGTHRLIQKDIQFKDLGLVIIDEEQRFGVEHKERLKQLRKLVDVITMTATPIPRTLYMSMNSIRDMSIIETPPRERIPIETYVLEYNEDIIGEAIRREVERGGQVYYVHNRVKSIDEKAGKLRRRLPSVSIEIAHGQMDERDLEEIMQGFFGMEFQVLVTTTIIESGLDIPNVNTIIIERADRFGLSQLYQLRGRVGRSKRKAYAYLFHPSGKVITEQAQKRLSVINDHTALGSGFNIALKDLEIRGAGNILGRQQHGDMLAVGFEMYIKLLDEAIRELRGTIEEGDIDPVLDLRYKAYIPNSYIESESLRVELYKRISSLARESELEELQEEMRDRFGAIPGELDELFIIVMLRILCKRVGIKILRDRENELQLTFSQSKIDVIWLMQKISENRKLFNISPKDRNTLHIYRGFRDNADKYAFLKEFFKYDGSE
jgi:transcription-repair coupling factor (superfamily II helicase)